MYKAHIYIYIYIDRERERKRESERGFTELMVHRVETQALYQSLGGFSRQAS